MEIENREVESEYNGLMNRIGGVFYGELGFRNAEKYIRGLMSDAERKNGWQIAEQQGENAPYNVQQFINRGVYSSNELRDELRGLISMKKATNPLGDRA